MLPVLILLYLVATVTPDPVSFHVEISCPVDWCGALIIYEEDDFPNHDIVAGDMRLCGKGGKKWVSDYGSYDLGWEFSPHYEFKYTLTHNCTSDGLTRCMVPRESQDVWIFGEWVTVLSALLRIKKSIFRQKVSFEIDAYGNGVLNECLDPNISEEDYRRMKEIDI
ncbi:hypothetical protein CAEBREN_24069 [Caenorhabditis brenneri]|uniref:Uncharacterized protein n=1 Tax=Caenorhabditis brenneri TaxID=135651 RepID=G0N236_CAEBE|nr:hypothetical protein CAEBREN_24069 [Caenorhabditis brenneri]